MLSNQNKLSLKIGYTSLLLSPRDGNMLFLFVSQAYSGLLKNAVNANSDSSSCIYYKWHDTIILYEIDQL